jgi:lipopolysaccharide transport system ATP-binding protein
MKDTDTLVRVENVSKKFCCDLKKSLWYGMKDLTFELMGRPNKDRQKLRSKEFWAVKDVNFELRRGECLGLIGKNGAGKTTLLRMLNGLIKPDRGRIEMRGKIGALIALGAGFNPLLTGRENICVNAAVLGLKKKELVRKFDEIVDFAELDNFIDAPVQSYSSGMTVRLGFAVATVLDPDILILDEVLAVGDASFRDKCYHRIASIRKRAAVIFVSHNMEQIARTATLALLLKNGTPFEKRSVSDCIAHYEKINRFSLKNDLGFLSIYPPITDFRVGAMEKEIKSGNSLCVDLIIQSQADIDHIFFKLLFYNAAGSFAADGVSLQEDHRLKIHKGQNSFRVFISSVPLKNGKYFMAFNVVDQYGDMIVWSYKKNEIEIYGAYVGGIADCHLNITITPSVL